MDAKPNPIRLPGGQIILLLAVEIDHHPPRMNPLSPRLRFLPAALAAALPFFLLPSLACGQAAKAEPDVVRVGNLKLAAYGPITYMKVLAPKYNLKIEERIFAKGIDFPPAFIAGEVDVSAGGVDGAVAGRAGGAPMFIVAGFAEGGVRFVRQADQPNIKTIADLKGKKVGVTRGGAQELALLWELKKNGLTPGDAPGKDDLQIIYLPYADLNQAFQQKQLDAMCQSEPNASKAVRAGYGVQLPRPKDPRLGEQGRAFSMSEKLYKEKPELALRIVKCLLESVKTGMDQPAVMEKFVVQDLYKGQLSAEDYKDAVENTPLTFDFTVDHVQATSDLMQEVGVGRMKTPQPASEYVKTDLHDRAMRELGYAK